MPGPRLAGRWEAALTGLAEAGVRPSPSTNVMGQKDTPRTVLMFSEASVFLGWETTLVPGLALSLRLPRGRRPYEAEKPTGAVR